MFIGSSLLITAETAIVNIDNSTFSEGGYGNKPLVEFEGETLRFTNCSFEGNVLDQSVMLSIEASDSVGITRSSFTNNSVKSSDGSVLIAISGTPLNVVADQNVFSCNGIREQNGKMRYPLPLQMNVTSNPNVWARQNSVLNCPTEKVFNHQCFAKTIVREVCVIITT